MINPVSLFKLGQAKQKFKENHPKFPMFLKAVQKKAIEEGTVIEINVKKENGETIASNIKLQESDLSLLRDVLELMDSM